MRPKFASRGNAPETGPAQSQLREGISWDRIPSGIVSACSLLVGIRLDGCGPNIVQNRRLNGGAIPGSDL